MQRQPEPELMDLPHETTVHPGHTDPTTIGEEWEQNAFIRLWRGLDEEGDEPCKVGDDASIRQLTTIRSWSGGTAAGPPRVPAHRESIRRD